MSEFRTREEAREAVSVVIATMTADDWQLYGDVEGRDIAGAHISEAVVKAIQAEDAESAYWGIAGILATYEEQGGNDTEQREITATILRAVYGKAEVEAKTPIRFLN